MIIGLIKGPTAVTEFSVIGRLYFTAYAMFVLMIGPLWPTAAEAIRRGDIQWVRRTLRSLLDVRERGSKTAMSRLPAYFWRRAFSVSSTAVG